MRVWSTAPGLAITRHGLGVLEPRREPPGSPSREPPLGDETVTYVEVPTSLPCLQVDLFLGGIVSILQVPEILRTT